MSMMRYLAPFAVALALFAGCTTTSDGSSATDSGSTKGAAPAKPKGTVAQQQALKSAENYLDMSGFSRAGLIEQLTSKAGDGFKRPDAVWAVNHAHADWNKEAVEAAKNYLDMGGFSRASLVEQLSSKAGDQFTEAQAVYAANHVGLK